ncbi:MAG: choice-of-anchor tandem repeat GloVer-containing protein, partial [Vicinamibacteraceae bacterium]
MRIAKALILCLLPSLATAQPVQPVQVVHQFTPSPGQPNGPLVQVPGGDFYGVTRSGIIRLTTAGQVTEVARFHEFEPIGSLVLASDGALYGTAGVGSTFGRSTIFRFDPATAGLRTVYTLGKQGEGWYPRGGLVPVGGALYGVTQ